MSAMPQGSIVGGQALVDGYFESAAPYWDNLYSQDGLLGEIYRARRRVTLSWIQCLQLPRDACILDLGCGAGCTAVPLAAAGYRVVAVDRLPAMLQRVREHAAMAGVTARVHTMIGDATHLGFPSQSFDATIALGLLPWLESPEQGLAEIVRVTRPGGMVIVSADNSWRLNYFIDPLNNPAFAPLRRALGRQLRRAGVLRPNFGVGVKMYSPAGFDRALRACGLKKIEATTVGFGPFTVFRRELTGADRAYRLHRRLQQLADRRFPVLSHMGAHYLVRAQRPALDPVNHRVQS